MTTKKKAAKASSKKKRKVSHKGARAKGHQFEREIANELRHIFPDIQRKLEYRASDIDGADLENFGPYAAQLKNHQAYASINTLHKEVKATSDKIPLLITKGARMPAVVVMHFSDFVNMLEQIVSTEINNKRLGYVESKNAVVEGLIEPSLEKLRQPTPPVETYVETVRVARERAAEDFI